MNPRELRHALLLMMGLAGCAQDAGGETEAEDATGPGGGAAPLDGAMAVTDGASTAPDGGPSGTDDAAPPPVGGAMGPDGGDVIPDLGPGAPDARVDAPDADPGPPPPPCDDPQPVLQADGSAQGFVECGDGRILRVEAVKCVDPTPEGPACSLSGFDCAVDADCTERPFGHCREWPGFDWEPSCGCVYGCEDDEGCGPGGLCVCSSGDRAFGFEGSRCVRSACPPGGCDDGQCRLGAEFDGCGYSFLLACTTPADSCLSNEECDQAMGGSCISEGGPWSCIEGPVCGRPLRQGRALRVAGLRAGSEWTTASALEAGALSLADLARLREHWLGMAVLEHASIASFARFADGLLRLAAPPELLAEAARAMLDEVDHARRCFAVASALGGAPVGPGPLDSRGIAPIADLHALVAETIRDACVAETLGAAEATWLAGSVEPALRETFAVIAADELRHAGLGWRTLRWALEQPAAPSMAEVVDLFALAMNEMAERAASDDREASPMARRLGCLSGAERCQVFATAMDQVVRPCVAALAEA